MKTKIFCELFCSAYTYHLSQIYTGFGELRRAGLIDVKLTKTEDFSSDREGRPTLTIRVNNNVSVAYDVADGYVLHDSIDLGRVDYCFKRSLRDSTVQNQEEAQKLLPLGLNYPVTSRNDFSFILTLWSRNYTDVIKRLALSNSWIVNLLGKGFLYSDQSIQSFEALPLDTENPRVIFMARVWDPGRVRSPTLQEERNHINNTRAAIIRTLRAELGDQFQGGLYAHPYAVKNYSDCLISNQYSAKRANYLKMMQSASICIATMGLEESVGWKFGEYVAGAKAIVSERFDCRLPGNFAEGKNYFEFTTVDECVARVFSLLRERNKRHTMMQANYDYYQNYLRPDALIWNTLTVATM